MLNSDEVERIFYRIYPSVKLLTYIQNELTNYANKEEEDSLSLPVVIDTKYKS